MGPPRPPPQIFRTSFGLYGAEAKTPGEVLCRQARKRICCAPLVVAVVKVGLDMELVRAGFGDGIDHSPGGAAVFRGIVRSVYLKLLHCRLGDGIPVRVRPRSSEKERLVVVGAVYG